MENVTYLHKKNFQYEFWLNALGDKGRIISKVMLEKGMDYEDMEEGAVVQRREELGGSEGRLVVGGGGVYAEE